MGFLKDLALNVGPAIIGNMIGGPAGAMALQTAFNRGSGDKWGRAAVKGALSTASVAMGGNALAHYAPGMGQAGGLLSRATGLHSPSLLSQLGIASAPITGGGLGFIGNMGQLGVAEPFLHKMGLSGLTMPFMGGRGLAGMLGTLGQVTGIGNMLGGGGGQLEQYAPEGEMQGGGGDGGSMESDQIHQGNFNPINTKKNLLTYLAPPRRFKHVEHPSFHGHKPKRDKYKTGGEVTGNDVGNLRVGYINEGDTDGTADDVKVNIPKGSHIWTATEMSMLGNGNPDSGAKKLAEFEGNINKSTIMRMPSTPHAGMRAWVSNKEYVMRPETVIKIGEGDAKNGAKKIDLARMRLREHKTLKNAKTVLTPNAKNVGIYLKG